MRCRNEGPSDRAELVGHVEGSSIPPPAFIACGGLAIAPAFRAAAVQPDLDAARRGGEARHDDTLGREDEEIVVQECGHAQTSGCCVMMSGLGAPDRASAKAILPELPRLLQQYNADVWMSKF